MTFSTRCISFCSMLFPVHLSSWEIRRYRGMSCMSTKNYQLRLPSATFWIICSCEDKQSNFCEKYQNPVAGRMIKSFLTDRVTFSLSIPSRSPSPPTFTLTLTLHPDSYPYPYPHPWCYPYPRFTNAANLEQRAPWLTWFEVSERGVGRGA